MLIEVLGPFPFLTLPIVCLRVAKVQADPPPRFFFFISVGVKSQRSALGFTSEEARLG